MTSGRALLLMARPPVKGRVKTRLAADIGDGPAFRIYSAMLEDTLNFCGTVPDVTLFIYWASSEWGTASVNIPANALNREQSSGDLGQRMASAAAEVAAEGYAPLVIIGSDAPELGSGNIHQAFSLLESGSDVIFGPSSDGGYYLIGMNVFHGSLFSDIPWSTSSVLDRSVSLASECCLSVSMLPVVDDIDSYGDLLNFLDSGRCRSSRTFIQSEREVRKS